jgi:hypothetical protein
MKISFGPIHFSFFLKKRTKKNRLHDNVFVILVDLARRGVGDGHPLRRLAGLHERIWCCCSAHGPLPQQHRIRSGPSATRMMCHFGGPCEKAENGRRIRGHCPSVEAAQLCVSGETMTCFAAG